MCCFSGPVEHVSGTQIFARHVGTNRQVLVYQMQYSAKKPVAMILPLPVPRGTQEKDVQFINLEKYATFFDDLLKEFIVTNQTIRAAKGELPNAALGEVPLEVIKVGKFVASFVPTIADFKRLDEQFRLPDSTWDKIPLYKNYGFAVFQLKTELDEEEEEEKFRGFALPPEERMGGGRNPVTKVHPMAFSFPSQTYDPLFFPTVHIHDGKIYAKAEFDHDLYMQLRESDRVLPRGWRESSQPAKMFMKMDNCQGIVAPKEHCYHLELRGKLKNEDTLV